MSGRDGSASSGTGTKAPRVIALVGPYQSGKTSLMEEMLHRCGAVQRPGSIQAGTTFGDPSPEARTHQMSVETNIARINFMDEDYVLLDCPGSVEFGADLDGPLSVCDMAVVVCEPDAKKLPQLQLLLARLEDRGIPRLLFLNKIDKAEEEVSEALGLLQRASRTPLVMRQIPIWKSGIAIGFVDLALERAHVFREHTASEIVAIPANELGRGKDARFSMLEKLADYDDRLMETLLSDLEPARDQVFDDLRREMREGLIVPVMMGSAARGNGALRLLKALRHDSPRMGETSVRVAAPVDAAIDIVRVINTTHGGRMAIARVMSGSLQEGAVLQRADGPQERLGQFSRIHGGRLDRIDRAEAGDLVAIGKIEHASAMERLATRKADARAAPARSPAVTETALSARERKDEAKLSTILQRLVDEDRGLSVENRAETHQLVLQGQGEVHLKVTLARIARAGVAVTTVHPRINYVETIQASATQRGRHRKQSGGHGQFGDVVLEIAPRPRGSGFSFVDNITGGVVPRQYIPAVEEGVIEALKRGPFGFPVVDVEVRLTDGSFHPVDSSDQAFHTAGALGIREGLPNCRPVLLEPVLHVDIFVPNEATPRVNAIVTARRGQILGLEADPDREGFDIVRAEIPASDMRDLIIDIRSASSGVGTFTFRHDHMAELTGRLAEKIVGEQGRHAA